MNQEASDLRPILAALPKVELHRHLEGSLRLATLAEIAREHDLDVPSYDAEVLRPYVQVVGDPTGFAGYLAKFKLLRHFYLTRDVVVRLVYECIADAAHDNVKYLELRFSPVALSKIQGFTLEEVTEWVILAAERAQAEHDIQVRLLVTIGREENAAVARRVAEVAVAARNQGMVGLDLAGDEVTFPAAPLVDVFEWAYDQGMHITIHAGEAGPAANIRAAIEEMHTDRIGHGVHAGTDPAVVRLLAERRTTLEMCPTSNLHTGAVSTLRDHPLQRYQEQGVRVTINTDDPGISDTTLTDEYLVAVQEIGMTPAGLRKAIIEAAESAFLPEEERARLVDWFESELPTPLWAVSADAGN
jgi:adenosine deaminase